MGSCKNKNKGKLHICKYNLNLKLKMICTQKLKMICTHNFLVTKLVCTRRAVESESMLNLIKVVSGE